MNWDAVGAVAELLSAIGVIATLAYLGIQVRHSKEATEANTRQMRGQAFVALNESVQGMTAWLLANPESIETVLKADSATQKDELSTQEQRLSMFWNATEASYYELAFMLWQQGALDEESYVSREEYFLSVLLQPGRHHWWNELSYLIDPRFRVRIDERLKIAKQKGHLVLTDRLSMYTPYDAS